MLWCDVAVTPVLETTESEIHHCPACGANCAVDHDMLTAAADASKTVRTACHKCDEPFRPQRDKADGLSRPGQPNPNPRIGLCGGCGKKFSVPPPAADESVLVECPPCRHQMAPDAIGRADARRELMSGVNAATGLQTGRTRKRHRWLRLVWTLLIGGTVLAGAGVVALETTTPNSTPNSTSLAALTAPPAPRLAVTDAGFGPADTDATGLDGKDSVLVSVTLANLGTTAGAPQWVIVKLLGADGTVVGRRLIASREMTLAPGARRTLVTRMSGSGPATDVVVEPTRATSRALASPRSRLPQARHQKFRLESPVP